MVMSHADQQQLAVLLQLCVLQTPLQNVDPLVHSVRPAILDPATTSVALYFTVS